ncbi:hypothetical protein HYDPIDRAFT_42426 [Hydnomerulius pinastri MD-312]|uniref:EamA domain-containing protein n=1 Tax=Hydnomerulius pinastri MD-312 TaxID=994086 RepID=A0A0C9V7V5_9AGAM|nr:hypothetical protein HYDPIDRAFT_42426 [Hydnomerulius pinastri MD-312]
MAALACFDEQEKPHRDTVKSLELGPPGGSASPDHDKEHSPGSTQVDIQHSPPRRPPISYKSPGLFFSSLFVRFRSIWTRSFAISLACGQLLSLCVTVISVFTTELVSRGWVLPNTQVFLAYSVCFWIFTPYTMYRYGLRGWWRLMLHKGWKYFLLGFCDVEASFLYVKAFGYTDLLSCMLLDAWSIPVCLFVCWLLMGTKYHWTQIFGVLVSVVGLGMLVASDFLTKKDGHPKQRAEGDGFMVAAATLYGLGMPTDYSVSYHLQSAIPSANSSEEIFARHAPLYEVIGQMGMWGMIISGVQTGIIEHKAIAVAPWDRTTVGLLFGNVIAASLVYSIQPYLFRVASSAYFNISLLTSDFYGLIFGLFLFHYSPYWLYFPAFVVVVIGLLIYFWHATPEEQGPSDVHIPGFVRAVRGETGQSEA